MHGKRLSAVDQRAGRDWDTVCSVPRFEFMKKLTGTVIDRETGPLSARPFDGQEMRADYNFDHEDERTGTIRRPFKHR